MIISRFHNFRFFCVMSEFQCVHNSQQITYVRAGIKEVYRTQRSKSHPISQCSALICQLLLLWVVFGDVFQVLHFLFDKSQDFLQTLLLEKWKKVHNAPAHIAWKSLKSLILTTLRAKRAAFIDWKSADLVFLQKWIFNTNRIHTAFDVNETFLISFKHCVFLTFCTAYLTNALLILIVHACYALCTQLLITKGNQANSFNFIISLKSRASEASWQLIYCLNSRNSLKIASWDHLSVLYLLMMQLLLHNFFSVPCTVFKNLQKYLTQLTPRKFFSANIWMF